MFSNMKSIHSYPFLHQLLPIRGSPSKIFTKMGISTYLCNDCGANLYQNRNSFSLFYHKINNIVNHKAYFILHPHFHFLFSLKYSRKLQALHFKLNMT